MLRGNPAMPLSDIIRPESPDDPAFKAYVQDTTYRPAFVCPGCYHALDSVDGLAEIGGKTYNIAGKSRGGKAPVYDDEKRRAAERRQADRDGLPTFD
jgi:hypothetical protein